MLFRILHRTKLLTVAALLITACAILSTHKVHAASAAHHESSCELCIAQKGFHALVGVEQVQVPEQILVAYIEPSHQVSIVPSVIIQDSLARAPPVV